MIKRNQNIEARNKIRNATGKLAVNILSIGLRTSPKFRKKWYAKVQNVTGDKPIFKENLPTVMMSSPLTGEIFYNKYPHDKYIQNIINKRKKEGRKLSKQDKEKIEHLKKRKEDIMRQDFDHEKFHVNDYKEFGPPIRLFNSNKLTRLRYAKKETRYEISAILQHPEWWDKIVKKRELVEKRMVASIARNNNLQTKREVNNLAKYLHNKIDLVFRMKNASINEHKIRKELIG